MVIRFANRVMMLDSVNMYASCYILTKVENLIPVTPRASISGRGSRDSSADLENLEI